MIAGRELDVLVAEKVMGQSVTWREGIWSGDSFLTGSLMYKTTWDGARTDELLRTPTREAFLDGLAPVPHYSTEIAAAWQVLEQYTDAFIEKASVNYRVIIEAAFEADAPSAPHAICLAALQAVDVSQ